MQCFLKSLYYKIGDNSKKCNVLVNNIDYLFAFVYLLISLANAIWGIEELSFLDKEGRIDFACIKTLLIIVINLIVLWRLNIRLHIANKEKIEEIIRELTENDNKEKRQYDVIEIKAYNFRIHILWVCYAFDIAILLVIGCFGNAVAGAITWMVFVTAIMTFVNDIIDISVNKYSAIPVIALVKYLDQK